MLEGYKALCNAQTGKYIPNCNAEDLSNANAAYRYFLFGNGADRTINYEWFLKDDPSSKNLIENLFKDFEYHVPIIGKDRTRFSLTSTTYTGRRWNISISSDFKLAKGYRGTFFMGAQKLQYQP